MTSQDATMNLQRRTTAEGAAPGEINVGIAERLASMIAGGLLVGWGIRKHSAAGIAGAVVGADLIYRGVRGHCNMYAVLGVNTAGVAKPGSEIRADAPEVRRSITIDRSPEELYEFWRDPINLAHIVAHFAQVTPRPHGITHWRVRGPLKQVLEWDSRYIEEQPGLKLVWETIPGSTFVNRGEITFEPASQGAGSEVRLIMQFEPPLGPVGLGVVKALKMLPRGIAGKSLRRFKSLVETGEVPSLRRNPSGRGASDNF
jgi:uncharacterized membrane protein